MAYRRVHALQRSTHSADWCDPLPVFAGFTDSAIEAINLAEREAAELGSGYVGAEHVLLGLFGPERGLGSQALLSLAPRRWARNNRPREARLACRRGPPLPACPRPSQLIGRTAVLSSSPRP